MENFHKQVTSLFLEILLLRKMFVLVSNFVFPLYIVLDIRNVMAGCHHLSHT